VYPFPVYQVERVLDASSTYIKEGRTPIPLTEEFKLQTLQQMELLASEGLRVLALASRRLPIALDSESPDAKGSIDITERRFNLDTIQRDELEQEFTFLGLCGIYDPPRPESVHAVRACKAASITVHM
jgi:P-type Na+/K+ transporter